MSTNKKRVLAALLLFGSLAVWIPQLVGQRSTAGPTEDPDPESSAFLGALSGSEGEPHAVPLGGAPTHMERSAAPGAVSPGTPDSHAPAASGNSALEPRAELLERLAQAWGGGAQREGPPGGAFGFSEDRDSERRRARQAVEGYLAANPLGGILHGPERAVAILGSRLVHAGDELVPGELFVTLVARRHVDLRTREGTLRLELPPVAAAPRTGQLQATEADPVGPPTATSKDGERQP